VENIKTYEEKVINTAVETVEKYIKTIKNKESFPQIIVDCIKKYFPGNIFYVDNC